MGDEVHAWLNCIGFESVPVRDAPLLIGRSKDASFVLPHESVSRRHAVVAYRKRKLRIKNLSALGLELNGEELEGVADLVIGDKLQLGPYVIRVDREPERVDGMDEQEATLPYGAPRRRAAPPAEEPPAQQPDPQSPTRRSPPPRPRRPRP